MKRAGMSVGPPAVKPTTMRIGRERIVLRRGRRSGSCERAGEEQTARPQVVTEALQHECRLRALGWDCFAKFILGLAGGETRGLAMTRQGGVNTARSTPSRWCGT